MDTVLHKQSLESQLPENEEQLRCLAAHVPGFMMIIDPNGRIQYSNRSFPGFHPSSRRETDVFNLLLPEYHGTLREKIRQVQGTAQTVQFQAASLGQDGIQRWFDIQVGPLLRQRAAADLCLICTEITSTMLMQEALLNSLERLKRSYTFISALGQVAARIQQCRCLDQILTSMGEEFERMGLVCALLVEEPGHSDLLVEYLSLSETALAALEKSLEKSLKRFPISRDVWWNLGLGALAGPFFGPDAGVYIAKIFPRLADDGLIHLFYLQGERQVVPLIYVPWMGPPKTAGGLAIWGAGLCEDDMPAIQIFGNQVAVALENARLFQETQRLSTVDHLTGLYNRRHFMEIAQREVHRAVRLGESFALALLDIDHFKQINDLYGYGAGDAILAQVAGRLQENLRRMDVLARYSGEEFVILLPMVDLEQAAAAMERMRSMVADTWFQLDNLRIPVTVSIGLAVKTKNNVGLGTLIHLADEALASAKQTGRNCVRFSA